MKGKRTILLSLAVAVLGVLQGTDTADWVELVGEENVGWVVTGIGTVFAVLRMLTTTPVGKSTSTPVIEKKE